MLEGWRLRCGPALDSAGVFFLFSLSLSLNQAVVLYILGTSTLHDLE